MTDAIPSMKRPPRDVVFEQMAFKDGEFQHDSEFFWRTNDELAQLISIEIGAQMRSALSHEIAGTWVAAANQILRDELPKLLSEPDQAQQVQDELAHVLEENSSLRLGDATIEREISEVSHQLGQAVLSRWYYVLRDRSEGTQLNEKLLPIGMSFTDLLATSSGRNGLLSESLFLHVAGSGSISRCGFADLLEEGDLESLGVSPEAVIQAMKRFRDLKVKQTKSGVIAFGPKSFIRVRNSGEKLVFFCYRSKAEAKATTLSLAEEKPTTVTMWFRQRSKVNIGGLFKIFSPRPATLGEPVIKVAPVKPGQRSKALHR